MHGPGTEVDRSSLLAQTKPQIVDKVGEKRARQHGEGDDVEHDTGDSDDGAAPRFVFESFASQRRSRQCCQKGHEKGGAVRRVQVVESLPVWHDHDLRPQGHGNEGGQSSDRQVAVETVGGEDEKRNRGLADQDHHLPVLAAAESVTAVQEPSGLVDPQLVVSVRLSPEDPSAQTKKTSRPTYTRTTKVRIRTTSVRWSSRKHCRPVSTTQ